ncbi:MAG: restriction system modified-DNA reader domain-containing protein [Georgenia sp.]
MPFFEFDEGRLVPAQFGRPVTELIEPAILQAVRDQILQVVQRPLFPVSWHGEGQHPGALRPGEPTTSRMVAMDAAGQTVTVAVLDRLDSATLVNALSLSARNSDLGWTQLGELYPRGLGAFRRDWNAFRESMPPRPAPGPRLIIVAATVEAEARPALESLATSGVLVHEMSLRQMTSGRRFLEVNEVRPQFVAPLGTVLTASADRRALEGETTVSPASTMDETVADAAAPADQVAGSDVAAPADQVAGSDVAAPADQVAEASAPTTPVPTAGSSPAAGPAEVAEPAADDQLAATGPDLAPAITPARDDIAMIAASLGADTPLLWAQLRKGIRHEATLTVDGTLRLADGTAHRDPDAAAAAVSGRPDADGWRVWRFGESGPSLADARAELLAVAGRSDRRADGHGHRRA